ncbi:type I restriction endonuclease [Spirulina sp. CCNP1310]|uniref:type I restriction endonuclease n=1 Tax=Spirulina sp. CCNP1310 TaxID=3110249 RepID=UPI002B1FB659|nr:type I restriction endonuclease [Spirulina sp. CCNP1310]MEA5420484.1 type I restriction endonuclease [Spirulina sp. CCNP1310]
MTASFAIETTITTLQELETRFQIQRASDGSFFPEWQDATGVDPITLDDSTRKVLDHLRERFLNYYKAGLLTEGTVLLSILGPLLDCLGFHEPPYFVRSEVGVTIEVVERDEVYRGRMDVLIVRDRLWILTLEAKRSKFAADVALPQCLAYLGAAPQFPAFGLVTNGSDFIFCKLAGQTYDFSDPFSLLSHHNRLYAIAMILLRLKALL